MKRLKDLRQVSIGFGMILCSLVLPHFLQAHHMGIMRNLEESILHRDSGILLLASAKLVLLNMMRAVPLYAGTFVMAEGFFWLFRLRLLGFVVPLVLIPATYKLITLIYGISYDFGSPAYLTIIVIVLLHQMTVKIRPIIIKVLIITLFLFGLQWLDIVPCLSIYGFGRGELSVDIKRTAAFLDGTYTMNFVGLTFAIIIIINAMILARTVIDYYHRVLLLEESKKQAERLQRLEVEAVKSRSVKEMKSLVHDLKTPLVTIQGLSEVALLSGVNERVKSYLERVTNAAGRMSQMISEILYDNSMRELALVELFNYISVQLSPEELGARVQFDDPFDLWIYGNKIRLSRAIINLIENSLNVISQQDGWVNVQVQDKGEHIVLVVEDNGPGIPPDLLDQIWEVGYTTGRGHTGLGLNFVHQVITEHRGTINLDSTVDQGTRVTICLPKEGKEDDSDFGD